MATNDSDTDHLTHQLEQQHIHLKHQYEAVCAERDLLRNAETERELLISSLNKEIAQLASDKEASNKTIHQLESQLRIASVDQSTLRTQFERKNEEVDWCNEHIRQINAQLASLQGEYASLRTQFAEMESKQIPKEFEMLRLQREKQLAEQRVEELEKEVEVKSAEIFKTRRANNTQISDLQMTLSQRDAECQALKSELENLKLRLDECENSLNDKLSEIKTLTSTHAEEIETYHAQLTAQRKVSDLMKRNCDQATERVEELEGSVHSMREALHRVKEEYKERLERQKQSADNLLQEARSFSERRIKELEDEVNSLRRAEQPQRTRNTRPFVIEEDRFNVMEMLDELSETRNQLQREKTERKKVELYMHQMLKAVEEKAPELANKRREYLRMAESHNALSLALKKATTELTAKELRLQDVEKRLEASLVNINELEQAKEDLSRQVQNLLKKMLKPSDSIYASREALAKPDDEYTNADGVISDFLVTFDSIEQLQLNNIQLLRTIRRLSEDLSTALESNKTGAVVPSESDGAVVKQLEDMQSQRKHLETLVQQLKMDRDMYRTMYEQQNGAASTHVIVHGDSNGANIEQLQLRIRETEEENRVLKDRSDRFTHANAELEKTLVIAQSELSELRNRVNRDSAEITYQVERNKRMAEALQRKQEELNILSKKSMELQGVMVEQQKTVKNKEDVIESLQNQLSSRKSEAERLKVESHIARSMQEKLEKDNESLRAELLRSSQMQECLHRIEMSMQAKSEQLKESLEEERKTMWARMEQLRKQLADQSVVHESTSKAQEEIIQSTNLKLAEANTRVAELIEAAKRQEDNIKAAEQKNNSLEQQLVAVNERMAALQSGTTTVQIANQDATDKQLALEKALTECEGLRAELENTRAHLNQMRQLSKDNERRINQIIDMRNKETEDFEAKLSAAEKSLASTRAEVEDRRNLFAEQLKEIDDIRLAAEKAEAELKAQLLSKQEELTAATQELADLRARMSALQTDIDMYQKEARAAHANYERELKAHSDVASALRQAEQSRDEYRDRAFRAESKLAEAMSEVLEKEQRWASDKRAQEQHAAVTKREMEELNAQNQLLHAQLQTLGAQVEKFMKEKEDIAVGGPATASTDGDDAHRELIVTQQQTIDDLRRVISYLRKQKEVLEAKSDLSAHECRRLEGTVAGLQKALHEAQAEAQLDRQTQSSVVTQDEFNRLRSQLDQLDVLRESNVLLRDQAKSLEKELNVAREEAKAAIEKVAPMEEEKRKLLAELEVVTKDKESARKDLEQWRGRVTSLLNRYNEVDPEEHKQLKEQLVQEQASVKRLQETTDNLQSTVAQTEQALKVITEEKEKLEHKYAELQTSYNGLSESSGRNQETLRQVLRKQKESLAEKAREIERLKAEVGALQTEKATAAKPSAPTPAALAPIAATSTPAARTPSAAATASVPVSVLSPAATPAAIPVAVAATATESDLIAKPSTPAIGANNASPNPTAIQAQLQPPRRKPSPSPVSGNLPTNTSSATTVAIAATPEPISAVTSTTSEPQTTTPLPAATSTADADENTQATASGATPVPTQGAAHQKEEELRKMIEERKRKAAGLKKSALKRGRNSPAAKEEDDTKVNKEEEDKANKKTRTESQSEELQPEEEAPATTNETDQPQAPEIPGSIAISAPVEEPPVRSVEDGSVSMTVELAAQQQEEEKHNLQAAAPTPATAPTPTATPAHVEGSETNDGGMSQLRPRNVQGLAFSFQKPNLPVPVVPPSTSTGSSTTPLFSGGSVFKKSITGSVTTANPSPSSTSATAPAWKGLFKSSGTTQGSLRSSQAPAQTTPSTTTAPSMNAGRGFTVFGTTTTLGQGASPFSSQFGKVQGLGRGQASGTLGQATAPATGRQIFPTLTGAGNPTNSAPNPSHTLKPVVFKTVTASVPVTSSPTPVQSSPSAALTEEEKRKLRALRFQQAAAGVKRVGEEEGSDSSHAQKVQRVEEPRVVEESVTETDPTLTLTQTPTPTTNDQEEGEVDDEDEDGDGGDELPQGVGESKGDADADADTQG